MTPVGVIRDEGRHLMKCWACNYAWQDRQHLPRVRQAVAAYERAVEQIEAHIEAGRTFAVVDVVKHNGRFVTTWRAAGLAVHDMALHGLIECARRRNAGHDRAPACIAWRACDTARVPTPERTRT